MNVTEIRGNIQLGCLTIFLLIGSVISLETLSAENSLQCEETERHECLSKLQTFLKLTSLPFASDETELNNLCSELDEGLGCKTTLFSIPNCMSDESYYEFAVFSDLAEDSSSLFCRTKDRQFGYLREDLLKNADCISKQKKAFETCAEKSNLPEIPIMHILEINQSPKPSQTDTEKQTQACCSVSDYVRCAHTSVLNSCGESAGNVTLVYIWWLSGWLAETCDEVRNYYPAVEEKLCKISTPVDSGTATGVIIDVSTLASLLLVIFIGCQNHFIL